MTAGGYIQLRAALDGSFEHEVAAARGDVIQALGLSMEELADGLVSQLQQDFLQSGLRNAARLKGAAWRRKLYGAGTSLEPAAMVYSKIPLIIQAFENGQVIRARGAKGLLIPNPQVWPGGRVRRGTRGGAGLGSLWAQAEARFGPLHVVKRPGKTTLVVAEARESARRPGTFRKASATALRKASEGRASGLATIVVFVIAKEADQDKRLKSDVIKARAQRNAPGRMDQLFLKYFADIDRRGQRRIGRTARPAQTGGFWD